MLDQFKNMKQFAGLMGNAGQMREKFEALQKELETKTVEADAGAGAVRVTVNGKMQVTHVNLDPATTAALVGQGDAADKGMIEELIISATNAAMEKAQAMLRDELTAMTGGMNLPNLDGLLGGQS